ncbi:MAG: SDR family oxidoreductase [Armatimonadetes bacterium]|nr:SDR family oxidoreductase [Armatimonadota bacterium]
MQMTRALGKELGSRKIQVNAIAPGFIQTEFSRVLWENEVAAAGIVGGTPAGRIGQPEDLAALALYLASSGSDFVTGQTFTADGGLLLGPPG